MRMRIPFTLEQFLDVFARYNEAIWPAQIGAYVLGALVVALAVVRTRVSDRAVAFLLAASWAFVGGAYHMAYFSRVNPVADVFGAFFLLQAVLFIVAGASGRLTFGFASTPRHAVGLAFIAYAAVVYPLLGLAAGHAYPYAPMFGVTPCPTTIFTFGVLLLADDRVPRWLLPIPLLWSLVGVSAAVQLGFREDLGLVVAGVIGSVLIASRGATRRAIGVRGA